jgi:uncharacterized protein (TIGR03437 family)
MRDRVVPILEQHGVQAVLNGHEHSYQRTVPLRGGAPADGGGGTTYIITGGGGGPLHDINPSPLYAAGKSVHHYLRAEVHGARMTLTAIGLDGEIVDTATIVAPTQPVVEAVVNAGSYTPALGPGSLVSIFGRDLAVDERTPSTAPAALELIGTSVTVNDERIPLLFVSPDQINAQLPFDLAGSATLRVNTRTSSSEVAINVQSNAPAILETPIGFRRFSSVWRAETGMLVTPSTPAVAGEFVTVYLVGLGSVPGRFSAGQIAPQGELLPAAGRIEAEIGSRRVTPSFAGLVPGYVGLYQVNVRIPADAQGPNSLRIFANGFASQPATLFVAPQ